MEVKLVWATENGDKMIARMARVSNPKNENNEETAPKLISYLMKHKHWSPFEMANMCVRIETTRDISRQILRHRSFSFQEFSQRYAEVSDDVVFRAARTQDPKNRQNSILVEDPDLAERWLELQEEAWGAAKGCYNIALSAGIAKEVARSLLPEGLTPTVMYMNGTLRSWLHFLDVRLDGSTQKETREIASACTEVLKQCFPMVYEAAVLNRRDQDAQAYRT